MSAHNNPFAQSANYFQITFDLPQTAAEHAEHAFDDIALSVSAFEIDEAKYIEQETIWHCQILFNQPPDMAEITRRICLLAALAKIKTPEIKLNIIEQQDWLALVARNFPPLSIASFFVHGSHIKEPPPISAISIQVEAGAAFGSGEHGTTKTCLEAISWLRKKKNKIGKIIDVGTGSGILAIAAAKLWNSRILAVDIDPIAIEVTRGNSLINKTHKKIICSVSDGYKSQIVKRFGKSDLIISNILARPLINFAPNLSQALNNGGYAILSGLLDYQRNMVLSAHKMQGLKLIKEFHCEGWCTLLLNRPLR